MAKNDGEQRMQDIVSLAKRRGFIYQGSEIYGGLAGTWDYGPLGVMLKNNIRRFWWKQFVYDRTDMYGVDAAILMNEKVWQASGHVDGFSDPLVECSKCKHRFRADHLEDPKVCPDCKGALGEAKQFNMMFKTSVGATEGEGSTSYLRPETAQGIFVNFKNIVDSFHPKLPFGIAQIGKAFRNEIAPRDFIFRTREFEQMEIEYFVKAAEWEKHFEMLQNEMRSWIELIGLDKNKVHEIDVPEEDRAHYSKKTIDFEYDFPFGQSELYGLAYRTDYDLKKHQEASGASLEYVEDDGSKVLPHVIEPSLGMDRTVLALLCDAYTVDGDRTYLKFAPRIAPVIVAVSPLLKNKPELVAKAQELFTSLKSEFGRVVYDENGNIGKRYARQDEIGTPFCVVVDFDTLEGENAGTVTVRHRDTGEQERISIDTLHTYLNERIQ